MCDEWWGRRVSALCLGFGGWCFWWFAGFEPVGVLSFERDGRVKRLKDFVYHFPQNGAEDVVVDDVRYVKLKPTRNVLSSRLDSRFNGTVQMRVTQLLGDGVPMSIKQTARELGLEEDSVENAMALLYRGGAVLRTERPRIREAYTDEPCS